MRHTASSHRQMKALFFILLLAGHDAVRVTEEVGWSKSKWDKLHEDCSWAPWGCSEGCVRRPLPGDLTPGCRHTNAYLLEKKGLESYHAMVKILIDKSQKYEESCQKASKKCRRRQAQMNEAFQFIIRAFTNDTFTASLEKSDQKDLNEGFQMVLDHVAKDEKPSIEKLIKSMKCRESELLKDPKKVVAEVTELSQALFSDNPDAKQQAKLEIEAMPESCTPVSAEEEAEGLVKLKDLQKESEQERGEISLALDQLNTAIDDVAEEEETESAGSALQVSLSDSSKATLALQNSTNSTLARMVPMVFWGSFIAGVVLLSTFTSGLTVGWAILGLIGVMVVGVFLVATFAEICGAIADKDRIDGEVGDIAKYCAKKLLKLPLKGVKALGKGVAGLGKGIGKGIIKYFRKGKSSKASVLFETEDVMDEPLQAEPLALDEVSVS